MNQCATKIHPIPVIVSDIDGVLKQGQVAISQSAVETLKMVRSPLGKIDPARFGEDDSSRIPFLLLTNRGGQSQSEHAKLMNHAMGFDQDDNKQYSFHESENLLNHSSLIVEFQKYANDLILLLGNSEKVAKSYGATKCITKEEYIHAFPQIVPLSKITPEQTREARQHLKIKLNVIIDFPKTY